MRQARAIVSSLASVNQRIVSAGIIQPQFFAATDQRGPIIYLGVMVSDVREREDELGRFYAETLRHVRQQLGAPEAGAVMEVR